MNNTDQINNTLESHFGGLDLGLQLTCEKEFWRHFTHQMGRLGSIYTDPDKLTSHQFQTALEAAVAHAQGFIPAPVPEMHQYEVYQLSLTKAERTELNEHGWGLADTNRKVWAYSRIKFSEGSKNYTPDLWQYWNQVCHIKATGLEDVFKVGNMGPEEQITRHDKMHSVSVGDIIGLDGQYWMCDPCGFTQIEIDPDAIVLRYQDPDEDECKCEDES